jgi:Rha family phage regulatory protein
VFATSRDVAAFFGKEHKHVLRDIEALISADASIASIFGPIEIATKVGFGTRMDRAYEMDRDGFSLLAMGFTGPKALKFKLAYIAAFNEALARLKELEARATVLATPKTLVEALRLAADEIEKREEAERIIGELKPHAEIGVAIARQARGITDVAYHLPVDFRPAI